MEINMDETIAWVDKKIAEKERADKMKRKVDE